MIDKENLVCTRCLINLDAPLRIGRPHHTATFHAEFVHMTALPHAPRTTQTKTGTGIIGQEGHPPNGEKYRDTPFVAGEGVPNGGTRSHLRIK